MQSKFDAALLDKVGKLIRLCASNVDGEALSAVRALGRVLINAGLNFGDLAAAIGCTKVNGPDRSETDAAGYKRGYNAGYAAGYKRGVAISPMRDAAARKRGAAK